MFIRNLPSASGSGVAPSEIDMGTLINGGTAGSVLFIGAGAVLAQDNSNFFWDDTNNRLGIGTSSPSSVLHVTGSVSPSAGDSGYGATFASTLVEAGSGIHARLAGVNITAPTITAGAGSVTTATTLYISGAPSASGATNYVMEAAPGANGKFLLGFLYMYDGGVFSPTLFHSDDTTSTAWNIKLEQGGNLLLNSKAGTVQVGQAAATKWTFNGASFTGVGDSSAIDTVGTLTLSKTLTVNQSVQSSGTNQAIVVTAAAHTGQAANTELIDVYFNLTRTVTFATSAAFTTQRAHVVSAPTYAFAAASTVTTVSTMAVTAAPSCGSNATFTTPSAISAGGAATFTSVAGLNYKAVHVPAHTITLTGTTNVTATPGIAGIAIDTITVTDGSAVTVSNAAALYIAAAPAQGGSVTLSNTYAILVAGGVSSFGGNVVVGNTTVTSTNLTVGASTRIQTFGAEDTLFSSVSGRSIVIQSNLTAAAAGTDIVLAGAATRTAGLILDVKSRPADSSMFKIDFGGNATHTQTTTATGSPTILTVTGGTNATAWTAGTEAIDVNFNFNRTVTFASNTTVATQRAFVIQNPSYAFGSATGTITNAVLIDITGPPKISTNAAITNSVTLRMGGSATAITSNAAATYFVQSVVSHTATIVGNTNITSTVGAAAIAIGTLTMAGDTATCTITSAAALYIAAAPVAGSNVQITNPYAIWVDSGVSRFDGAIDLSNISAGSTNLIITATSDTPTVTWGAAAGNEASAAPAGYLEISVGGNARYIPFWA